MNDPRPGRRPTVAIPPDELQFSATRSSGHGGQNVNKRCTRVTLGWDVRATAALTPAQKQLVYSALAGRLVGGVLRVEASDERTQAANRRLAELRLQALVTAALNPPTPRIPGYVPAIVAAKRERASREAAERRWRERRGGPKKGRPGDE